MRRQILELADVFADLAPMGPATRRPAFALLQIAGPWQGSAVLPAGTDIETAVKWGWAKFCGSTEAESLSPTRKRPTTSGVGSPSAGTAR